MSRKLGRFSMVHLERAYVGMLGCVNGAFASKASRQIKKAGSLLSKDLGHCLGTASSVVLSDLFLRSHLDGGVGCSIRTPDLLDTKTNHRKGPLLRSHVAML